MTATLLASVGIASARPDEAQNNGFPSVISTAAPSVPHTALTTKLSGNVVVELGIGADGVPISAHAISGHPLLQKPTEQAALRWRFASGEKSRSVQLVFVYPKLTFGETISVVILPYRIELILSLPIYED